MDLSKLPKLSESPAPPPPSTEETPPVATAAVEPYGIEYAVICVGLGLILMAFIVGPGRIYQQLVNPSTLSPVTDTDGSQIPYSKSAIFWGDLGASIFCLLLIVDGIASGLTRSKLLRVVSMIVAAVCVLVNSYVIFALKSKIDLDLFNALSALIGLLFMISLTKQLLLAKRS